MKGLEIEFKDGNLKITNEKTSTEKVYENYKLLMKNSLFIESFIEKIILQLHNLKKITTTQK